MDKQIKAICIVLATIFAFIILLVMCNTDEENEEVINYTQKDIHEVTTNNTNSSSSETSCTDPIPGWEKIEIQRANTAIRNDNLTHDEKLIILYINLVRLNPKKFCDLYIERAKNYRFNKPEYISSLIDDLNRNVELPMLYPNDSLIAAARSHAIDIGNTGGYGHDSSDGTSFYDRVKRFGYNNPAGENCHYGDRCPLDVVLDLLVDNDVPSLGHRENILRNSFAEIGVSKQPHTKYDYNVVIDFGVE